MPSQSATDQKVVPLLPLRKNLDGSHRACCVDMHSVYKIIQSLNLASTNSQLYQREAILQRQRRNKHVLQRPKRSVNVLIFRRKLKSSNLQRKTLTLDQGNYSHVADHFGIGKTQIQAILKNKEGIMDAYASNETPNHVKRKRSSKYSDVNQAVWDWYIMCRNS